MKTRFAFVIILIFFLGGAFNHTAAESAFPTPDMATAQALDLPKGDAYLSPDGAHILLVASTQTGAKSLCIFSAAGQQETCGEFRTAPDFNSIRWSPDSRWIAFTENFFMYFRDSDIWVMDAQTGKVTDLTDDQIIKINITDMASNPSIDVVPTWTADSKQVLFIRYHGGEPDPLQKHTEKADLYQVSPEGGNAVQVGALTFPPNTPPLPTYALALAPDGKQIVYNMDVRDQKETTNGLWIADADGKNARQVLKVFGIVDAAFSADGRFVMGFNDLVQAQPGFTWNQSSNPVAALDGDKELLVDSEHAAQWAAWSPSGAGLAYIVRNPKQPEQDGLYVVDEPGKAGKQVYAGAIIPSAPSAHWRSLYWAANNTLLVQTVDRKFMLLNLGAKQ